MSDVSSFPMIVPALRIMQPLGEFFVTKLSARTLLRVAYTDPLRATAEAELDLLYPLTGAQREESLIRRKEIGRFINTVEAAFPNSIILGANYHQDGTLEEKDSLRWQISNGKNEECLQLTIPTDTKLASVIDGQHRLFGFKEASPERLSMELLCAVYLDIPNPYQAYLFATINFNQKKVDRSLAYELFGFNLEAEPPETWSPEKTAVFLCRRLNTDETSPLHQRIIVAAQDDEILFEGKSRNVDWLVSTATVVDGILSLISKNPKKDKDEMHKKSIKEGRSRSALSDDKSPLRKLYLDNNDLAIYTAVKNFFTAVDGLFWSKAPKNSYIFKTVGIQALFEILMLLLEDFETSKNISVTYFEERLKPASYINFANEFYQASGKGKARIKKTIQISLGLLDLKEVSPDEREYYKKLTEHS